MDAQPKTVRLRTCSKVSQELGSSDWFGSVCGQYPIQQPQRQAFETFAATLKQAAIAFAAVATTNVVLALKQVCCLLLIPLQ